MIRLFILTLVTLLPSSPIIASTEEVGRLFFTPSERTQLERLSTRQRTMVTTNDESDSHPSITVNGLIKRSDGSRIGWVNGKAQQFPASRDANKVIVKIPGKSQPIEMKVGQRLLLDTSTPSKAPVSGDDD